MDARSKYKYAKIAEATYKYPDAVTYLREIGPPRLYTVLTKYTRSYVCVVKDEKAMEIVMGIRGTRWSDILDTVANAATPLNAVEMTYRFTQAEDVLKALFNKYVKYKITVVGHSLGGVLAERLLMKYPAIYRAVFFNPAVLSSKAQPLFLSFFAKKDPRGFLYIVPVDPIGAINIGNPNYVTIYQAYDMMKGSPHAMEQFF